MGVCVVCVCVNKEFHILVCDVHHLCPRSETKTTETAGAFLQEAPISILIHKVQLIAANTPQVHDTRAKKDHCEDE